MTEQEEIKTILFGPRNGKSLLRLYPTLRENTKFKTLANDDLLFAWYMGIPTSPVDHDWSEEIRRRSAATKCFPTNEEKRRKYAAYDIPEDVKVAIREFEKFSPEARYEAKLMTQQILHNYQKIINVNTETEFLKITTIGKGDDKQEVQEVDWTAKKQYVDITATVSKALPELLNQLEEGFGIQETKKTEEAMGSRAIDKYHQTKKESK